MFSTTLIDEYVRIASTFDLGLDTIAQLVRNGVEASFLDSDAKVSLIEEIDRTEKESDGEADERSRYRAR